MTEEVRQKIAKVYELVKRGVNGEKQSAERALERLIKKYNVSEKELDSLILKKYSFKYVSEIDKRLLFQLLLYFFEYKYTNYFLCTGTVKEIRIKMEYTDYIQVVCAYEYFRRHMNKEWKKHALPILNRCRTTKTKNKRRKELQEAFFSSYLLASKIYRNTQISNNEEPTESELRDFYAFRNVQGGTYNQQVTTGLYLN